jgi:hypothetical protein
MASPCAGRPPGEGDGDSAGRMMAHAETRCRASAAGWPAMARAGSLLSGFSKVVIVWAEHSQCLNLAWLRASNLPVHPSSNGRLRFPVVLHAPAEVDNAGTMSVQSASASSLMSRLAN